MESSNKDTKKAVSKGTAITPHFDVVLPILLEGGDNIVKYKRACL